MRSLIFIAYATSIRTVSTCADPEGGGEGGPEPPEQSQNIGFLSNIGPDPQAIIGIGQTAKRHLNGVSLVGR